MKFKDYVSNIKDELGRVPKIGFFGLGLSNLSLLEEALRCGCEITLRSDGELVRGIYPAARTFTGRRALADIDEDVILLSPSVRREGREELVSAKRRGVKLTSDAELFFLDGPHGVFAVTGSDGKSTTATLAHALLLEEHPTASLVGNIGIPFSRASDASSAFVAELSSFQLRYATPKTDAAIITSVTPNHLDWHESFSEYVATKLALLHHTERAVLSADDEVCRNFMKVRHVYATYSARRGYAELKRECRADVYATVEGGHISLNGEPLIPISAVTRREWYNILNLMGAMCLVSGHYSREHLHRVAAEFRGLAHRCESFFSHGKRAYIDSSIDTTPARAAATLLALDRPVSIILGGRGKHLPLGELCTQLRRYAVRIALYSEAGDEYYSELKERGITAEIPTMLFDRFADAVEYADGAEGESAVLLSPAATGYGEFKSYAERGDAFKRHIRDKYGHNRKEV